MSSIHLIRLNSLVLSAIVAIGLIEQKMMKLHFRKRYAQFAGRFWTKRRENLYHVMRCKHTYHKACIIRWKREKSSCPCCRGPLPDELGLTLGLGVLPSEDLETEITTGEMEMTTGEIIVNVAMSPVVIIQPLVFVILFLIGWAAFFSLVIVLGFFISIMDICQDEEHNMIETIGLVFILCLVYPFLCVASIFGFVLQVLYILNRTLRFYSGVFTCRRRWSNVSPFIVEGTRELTSHYFELLRIQ